MNNHVILCGLGELGYRTLERLRAFGEAVVVVDPDPKGEFKEQLAGWNVRLIRDHGKTTRALREANALTARALIAVTDDDLTNLAIALAAREENPDIRLVVRLFNHRLIDKVEREIPNCRVLDVAALSAPEFALAGLHDDVLHCLDVPGGRFLLRPWRGQVPAGARVIAVKRQPVETYQAVGPAALGFSLAAPPEWEILPAGPFTLGERDVAYGLLRAAEAELGDGLATADRTPRRAALGRVGKAVAGVLQKPIALLGLVLVTVFAVSLLFFEHQLGLHWYQAVYFVATMLMSQAFGYLTLKDATPLTIFYGTGLTVAGAVLMAAVYAAMTDFLLSMRLSNLFDRPPVPRRGHFVLCGFGTVGFRIAEELRALGYPTVGIERQENSRVVEKARRLGVPVVVTPDIHGAMGTLHLDRAAGVMAVTEDDAMNLELAIAAQEINPELRAVVRMFDPQLAGLVERSFGIQMARSPSAIAAPAFAVAATAGDLLDAFDLGDTLWCVGQLSLGAGHGLVGRRVGELGYEQIQALSHQPALGEWQAGVDESRVLAEGDQLVVLTPRSVWMQLKGY